MSWISTVYLVCFVVGFVLTLLSLLLGHWDLNFHLHSLDGIGHGLDHAGIHVHPGGDAGQGGNISPINFSTVMAFLTWFGGIGYLLTHYYRFWLLLGLGVATISGLAGATLIFLFMARVLGPRQTQLDPADFELVGTLARISVPIHEKGTGEIIFSLAGTRRTSGARSQDGRPMERDTEVVITRYEKGLAYVQRWEEFAQEKD